MENIENFLEIISSYGKFIVFILPFIWGIYEFYEKKKSEVKIQKLEKELELGNQQKILNDGKFRESYQNFINIMVDKLMENKPDDIKNDPTAQGMVTFIKSSLLFAGPKTITAFGNYMRNAGKSSKNGFQTMWDMENVILNMREDMNVSNERLEQGDILQVFINEDIKSKK